MSIIVKGADTRIEVDGEEVDKDLSVKFYELTEEGQKRVFKENKDIFFFDALKSSYMSVRNYARSLKEECSSETLNEAIKNLIIFKVSDKITLIIELLNTERLEIDEELRKTLANSDYWKLRLWVAEDKNTSLSILKEMLPDAIKRFFWRNSSTNIDAIITNSNFELDEEVKQILEKFSLDEGTKIEARIKELT